MGFALSEEQIAFEQTAFSFANDELSPRAREWDEKSIFPVEAMRKAAGLGFAGLYVSQENGGCGMSRFDASLIFQSLSYGCITTAAYISIHNMVAWMIDTFGSAAQAQRWLPELLSMDKLGSYCLTEPSSGSDAASLKTTAIRDGNHYVLNGEKAFISGGGVSDIYVVMARTGGSGADGISAIVVEKGTPGLSFGVPEKKMGWKSQPTTSVIFQDCRVPIDNLLGQEGQGFKIAMKALDGGRINIASCSLGGAKRAIDLAKSYMDERTQFGKKLNEFQSLQFKFADMATEWEAARLMVHRGATMLDQQAQNATVACAMAKRFATDMGFRVANDALQMHGGYGYISDYEIERIVRDLRVHQILEGTNEIMRVIVARKMLGE